MVRKSARRKLLTEADIMEKLRERGLDSLDAVREAYVEPDGRINVITARGDEVTRGSRTSR